MGKHKIKHIVSIFLLLIAFCNTFCNSKSATYRQLEEVESLLYENKDSNAAKLFKEIAPPQDTTAALALYNYLYAKMYARNNKFLPSNTLDYSIEQFESTNDSLRLSYAYTYKSIFLLNENNKIEARKLNYAAERIASNLNDDILIFNTYANGYLIAAYHYDTDECLSYANKAYQTGLKLHDTKRMAYPAVFLTMCFNEKDTPDSVKKYMAVCLNFINDYDNYTRSMVYNVFGDILSKTDDAMSEHYYIESISVRNNADAYNGLTRLYLKQGKFQQADTCYTKALRPKAYESNLKLMGFYVEKLEQSGDLTKAYSIRQQMYTTLDSLYQAKTLGLEQRITNQEKKQLQAQTLLNKYESKLIIYRCLLIVTILSLVFVCVKTYKTLTKRKDTTDTACADADITQLADDEPTTEIEAPDYKQNSQDLETGKAIYEQILNNQNISQFDKKAKLSFIKYYETQVDNFANELSETFNYEKLSVNAIIVLILQRMGKDKQTILDMLSLSDQAYRSLKSRTEKAKK